MSASRSRFLVALVVVSQLAPPFMFSGVAVALPSMGQDLGAGASSLGLVETTFLAGSAALLLPIGRLADASDKATIYKLALAGFAVVTALIGALSWMPAILALRGVQGALSAALAATGPALLADIVPPDRRGRAYGASLGAIYAGLSLGPMCAGFLIRLGDWRLVFFAGAALLVLVWLPLVALLPSRWRRPTARIDGLSVALIVASIAGLVGGSTKIEQPPLGYGLLALGLAAGVGFVVLQRRLEDPLLDVRALLGHRVMRSALFVQLLLYMSAYCSTFMLSIYLQVCLGHSAQTAGLTLAIGAVLMAATAPIAGALADRLRPRMIASLGVASIVVCTLLASTLDGGSNLGFVAMILVFQGLGFGLFSSPNMTLIMNSAEADAVSMASALSAKARSLGMISGMLVVAVLISLELGDAPVESAPATFIEISNRAFAALAGLSLFAFTASLLAGRHERPTTAS